MKATVSIEKEIGMITLPVGQFKAHFSDILKKVENGEEFVISFGKRKQNVAAVIPFSKYKSKKKVRTIGMLKGKSTCRIKKGFKMSETEFLST